MSLIRQANARDLARNAIVLDLGDLQRQAAAIIADAHARSAAIAAAAQLERTRILAGTAEKGRVDGLAAGREEGHKAGFAEGRAAAIAELKPTLSVLDAGWSTALAQFQSARDDILQSAQTDVLRLAIRIGERITKRQIHTDPQVAAAQLSAVLAIIVRPSELLVRINPEDRPVLTDALPSLLASFSQARHLDLLDDPSISRGSCRVAMRGQQPGSSDARPADAMSPGEIDATISVQLDRIVQALLPDAAPLSDLPAEAA